jgi:hypothetical protein
MGGRLAVKECRQMLESGGDQDYYEDCEVCCRPIRFGLHTDGEDWNLEVRREDD